MGPETLLFFSYLLFLGGVVSQPVDYCPPQSVFGIHTPVVCSSFGTGHIHTWDGLAYDFHEYGDFYLVNGGTFSVQIRQIDCQTTKTQAVPITTTTEFSATCVQAYVITASSQRVQFNHVLNNDYLNVTVNGVSQGPASSGSVAPLSWQITPIYYTNPYKAWKRDSLDFMPDADFAVTISGAPVDIMIKFFSSGYSSISLYSDLDIVGGWDGLCGFADGCAANDLALSGNDLVPLPYGVDATKFLATSNGGNAGALGANRQFVNNTKDPNNWVPYFGSSWRATQMPSDFATPTDDLYNIRLTKTKYPAPQTGCHWPSNWDIPSFISAACAVDNAAGSDPDGFDQFPAKSIYLDYCNYYCDNGVFPFRNPALQAHQCNGFCQYPKGSSDLELHATYNNETFPPYSLQYSTESLALFISKLTLGGTYTFNLATNDSCEARTYNLSRTIKCTNTLSIDKFESTPSTSVARNHWYGFPIVCVTANVPAGLVRASWIAVAWPGLPSDEPTLLNPLSFSPCFKPSIPGNYTFEHAVYDGCQIKKQNLTIVAECSSCPSASIIGLDNVKEVLWGLNFNSAAIGITKSATTTTYPTKTFIARSQSADWPTFATLTYEWSVVSDDDSRDIVVNTGGGEYTVFRYPDASVSEFAMMYPDGWVVNNTMSEWSLDSTTNDSYDLPGFVLSPLRGPVGTTYGVYPPQREFAITRDFTVEQIVNTTTSVAYNVTYVQKAIDPEPRCQFNFGSATETDVSTTFATQSLYSSWNYGEACVGEYNVQLRVAEAYCSNSTDVQKVVVDCGPVPEVYVACESRLAYNYNTRIFPTTPIDAARSLDVYGRDLIYLYTIIPPAGSVTAVSSLNPPNCGTTGCTSTSPTFTPDVEGTYIIQVEASTSCNSNAMNATIIAWCNGTASQVNAEWSTQSGAVTFNYDGSLASQQIVLDASASTTDAPNSFPTFLWTVEYVPSPFAPAPTFTNPTVANPTLTATVPGDYKVTLVVSQGCGQTSTNVQNLTMVCSSVITPVIDEGSVINVDYTPPTGWDTVTLTSTSSSTSLPITVNNWQLHDTNLNTTTSLGSGASINVAAPTYGVLPGTRTVNVELISGDGCQFANTSIQINYLCFPLQLVVASLDPNVVSGTTVTLDASASVVHAGVTVVWTVVSVPADLQGIPPAIVNPNSLIAQITPLWKGTYVLMITITDGCTTLNQTVTFTVSCTTGIAFSPTATPASLVWNATAFRQVALAANFAGKSNTLTYTYRWRVLSAPELSIFYPNQTFTSEVTSLTINSTIVVDNYEYIIMNTSLIEVNTTIKNYTRLPNAVSDTQSIFPSCFYPDLAGTYTLELWAQDTCQANTQTISVTANCAAPPALDLKVTEHANFNSSGTESHYVNASGVNTWTVALSRAAPRRVVLDARGTTSQSHSRLTYYWAWAEPDPRYNTTWAQDEIETPYASTAALLLNRAGDYHLNLVVHDGCSWSVLNFTITATCSEPRPTLTTSAMEPLDGSHYYTFALSMAQNDNQIKCSNNLWQLTNFSAEVKNTASRYVTSLPLLVALFASILALYL